MEVNPRYRELIGRLRTGEVVIIDAATGTACERRGVPQLPAGWNGGAALSHPNVLRDVHADYLAAGAEIIISNTFATSLHVLEDAGEAHRFEEYNRRAVEIAVEARDLAMSDAVVAGGISYWSFVDRHPPLDELAASVRQQAHTMAAAGAELLMLEMMVDIDKMLATLDGALAAGLPVWVGLSCGEEIQADFGGGPPTFRSGDRLDDALRAAADYDVDLVSIMHTDVRLVSACVDVVAEQHSGPIGVYAHAGDCIDGDWVFTDVISPADYVALCHDWVDRGVRLLGSCCGTGVQHTERLASETWQ